MIPALVLFAQMATARDLVTLAKTFPTNSGPVPDTGVQFYDGWTIYETQTAGYNSMMAYGYKRKVFIAVGPPELPSGTPGEPPDFKIRWAIAGIKEIVSVPRGQVCDPAAPMWHEYGQALFGSVLYGTCTPEEPQE